MSGDRPEGRGVPGSLGDDTEALVRIVRGFHEAVRGETSALLERARRDGDPALASRPGRWGAGDLGYALDEAVEHALDDFGRALGARGVATVVAEGPGERRYAPVRPTAAANLRAIVDPIDGTRALMHDLRPAWALTGLAPDRGAGTRLSDVHLSVQTELPLTTAGIYRVLIAVRGQGTLEQRRDVRTGALLEERPLHVREGLPLDNAYLPFVRYLPVERTLVAELERGFLERLLAAHALSPRLLYDDSYLCSAGMLHLVASGPYRLVADLRAWIGRTFGVDNFTAKPYDLAALLAYTEAGVVVLDAEGRPLDAPLDTETPLDVVAYAGPALREAYEPHLRAAMDELRARPR